MAIFEPFAALRFAPETLSDRVAPPYDVLSEADVRHLRDRGPIEVTRIDVPTVGGGDHPYDDAAQLMSEWIATGELRQDDRPSFTICRMAFVDEHGNPRRIDGVIGQVEVVDEGAGGVLAHERTTPKASTDRLDLTRSTKANLSPIWGLSAATGLTELLAERGELVGEVTWDGVTHRFERIVDPERCLAISACIATADILIADGHHRYGVAQRYRDEVRESSGRDDTGAERTLMFVNEMVAEQLAVAAIHRVYRQVSADDLIAELEHRYEVLKAVLVDDGVLAPMSDEQAICLVKPDGTGLLMRPRHGAFAGIRDLDGLRLEQALSGLDHEVSYQHGVSEVLGLLHEGAIEAAVLIRPVSVDEIQRTAHERDLMPPKSTFFTPKLLTGGVIRPM
jgi:uncharacterized protein (DUF1015 family)